MKKYSIKNISHKMFLTEQEKPQQTADFEKEIQKPISLDQVVDRYLVRYEREAIPLEGEVPEDVIGAVDQEEDQLTEMKKYFKKFLKEQDAPEEPVEDAPAEEPAGDAPDLGADLGADLGGDAAAAPADAAPEAPVVNTPKIDLNSFAQSCARLVNNFGPLLNPKTIILNRIEQYIRNNYNEKTAQELMDILERNYGLKPETTEYPESASEFPTPYSGTAGPSGGSA